MAKDERDCSPAMSLDEALKKQPVSFSGRKDVKEERGRERKEVNLAELKKTLEESLGKMKPAEEDDPEEENEGFKRI